MAGRKDLNRKLPPNSKREKLGSFGREDEVARIPGVVIALPRVDVPLPVVGVPVEVHDARALSYPQPSVPLLIEFSLSCI